MGQLMGKHPVTINVLQYSLIYTWMVANDFIADKEDRNKFVKSDDVNLQIHIVSNGESHSFMILFPEDGKIMSSFTGDLNLPTLLGYLLWNSLIVNYKITK